MKNFYKALFTVVSKYKATWIFNTKLLKDWKKPNVEEEEVKTKQNG